MECLRLTHQTEILSRVADVANRLVEPAPPQRDVPGIGHAAIGDLKVRTSLRPK